MKPRLQPTPRELECLNAVAQGMNTAEIAALLGISNRTVDHHLANVMRKLNTRTRAESTGVAVALGLITLDLSQYL
ncbi:MAG: helix-turn-helix transcriptional regulator [Pseudomonadota bacterium]